MATEQTDPTAIEERICHQYFLIYRLAYIKGWQKQLLPVLKEADNFSAATVLLIRKVTKFQKAIPSTIATNKGVNKKNPFDFLNKYVPIPYAAKETTIPKYGFIFPTTLSLYN